MRALAAVVATVVTILSGSHVRAEGSGLPDSNQGANSDEYAAAIRKALNEFQLQHWLEAKAYFIKAHQLRPSARTCRGLGMVSYELRSYVEAVAYFRTALESTENPLTPEMRAEVTAAMAEAETFIARTRLALEPEGVTAVVTVNGQPPVFDRGQLLLAAGHNKLSVQADGFEPLSQNVLARAGERAELRLRLHPIAGRVAETEAQTERISLLQPAPQPATDASFWNSRSTQQKIGLTLGALGLVGIGVGATFGVLAWTGRNAANEAGCDDNECVTRRSAERLDDALTHAHVSTVAFAAGGAIGAAGVILYLTGSTEPRDADALKLIPVLSRRSAGLVMDTRW
jgi:hypothetical protein